MGKEIFISEGQTLLDIAIQETGSISTVFEIAEANGLNISDVLEPGKKMIIPDGLEPEEIVPEENELPVMELPKTVFVLERQTLHDLAVQETGNISTVFEIAEANGLSVSDVLMPGMKLIIPSGLNINEDIKDFFQNNQQFPANGWSEEERDEAERFDGIDFWIIEEDFIVQ